MKIAILGNGGREHAIALQISKSKNLSKLYCIPGNAGTGIIAENINLKLDNFYELYDFLKNKEIDLVISTLPPVAAARHSSAAPPGRRRRTQ